MKRGGERRADAGFYYDTQHPFESIASYSRCSRRIRPSCGFGFTAAAQRQTVSEGTHCKILPPGVCGFFNGSKSKKGGGVGCRGPRRIATHALLIHLARDLPLRAIERRER